MRSSSLLVGLGVLLAPLSAAATEDADRLANARGHVQDSELSFVRLVENERAPGRFLAKALATLGGPKGALPRPPTFGDAPSALDCVHAKHDIRLDPRTGLASAVLDLRIRAEGAALSSIGLALDEGLTVGTVTAEGRTVAVTNAVYAPVRIAQITLSPALKAGESTVVHIPYAGTLACGTYPEGGSVLCTKGEDFAYFAHQSVIPYIFDPAAQQDAKLDAMTRDIVLHVPSSIDVIATGERVSEVVDVGGKTSTWAIGQPLSRSLGMYVFAGKLGLKTVPGRSVPTTFVFPNPEMPVDGRLVSWSAGILDFVEALGGGPLPFQKSMTLVRLPANVGDPGTATFGMTLLSETYARAGDLMHEETWAHENSHLLWGIVVPEASALESRMLSEGLATLSEIDYTWSHHFGAMDRDTYLARRFVPIGLDLRSADGKSLPPISLKEDAAQPEGFRTAAYTLWAYYKTSATLDHLRVTVGDEAFGRGLVAYVKKCSFVGCTPSEFRAVLEETTGKDLKPFFERWVEATSRPQVSIGFQPVAGGAEIELTKGDAKPMTLELWLRLDDGQLVKRRVDLAGTTTRVHLDTGAWVRSVATSPRHDVLVDAKSAVEGDLDFDGEIDGIDLLRCTALAGKSFTSTPGSGLWNVDERFDPRCDVNGDLRVDDDDLLAISESFGTFRAAQ